jgi:hypothetical protein
LTIRNLKMICETVGDNKGHDLISARNRKVYPASILAGKGKAIPLQALTGPEGSRMLRIPDLKTIGT